MKALLVMDAEECNSTPSARAALGWRVTLTAKAVASAPSVPEFGLEPTSGTPVKLHDNFSLDVDGPVVGRCEQIDGHARETHLFEGGHDRVPSNLETGDGAIHDDGQVGCTNLCKGLVS